jgi:hypothetical protein
MRILRPVVSPSAGAMPMPDPKITRRGMVGSHIVRDQVLWREAIFLQELAHQFQRCCLIPLGLDQDIQNLSFAINGAPQIDQTSVDLEIDFVEMSCHVRLRPAFAQRCCDLGSKMIDLSSHGLIGHSDPALCQEIFDVAEAESKSDIEPDRLLNDHGRKAMAAVTDLCHGQWLAVEPRDRKCPTM